jgi:hypothetical protein
MAILRSSDIQPSTGTTLTLGASGDTVIVSSDMIKANTTKDAGGNTLWTSNGSGTLSNVNSGLTGGGMTLISTNTATGTSAINITTGIDSTYDEYIFVVTDLNPGTASVQFQFGGSTDGGSNYTIAKTSTYFRAYHKENDTGSSLGYDTGRDTANTGGFQQLASDLDSAADGTTGVIFRLFLPASTTFYKHYLSRSSCSHLSGSDPAARDIWIAGYFQTTSAINAISFDMTSGTFDGTVQMYGVG